MKNDEKDDATKQAVYGKWIHYSSPHNFIYLSFKKIHFFPLHVNVYLYEDPKHLY